MKPNKKTLSLAQKIIIGIGILIIILCIVAIILTIIYLKDFPSVSLPWKENTIDVFIMGIRK